MIWAVNYHYLQGVIKLDSAPPAAERGCWTLTRSWKDKLFTHQCLTLIYQYPAAHPGLAQSQKFIHVVLRLNLTWPKSKVATSINKPIVEKRWHFTKVYNIIQSGASSNDISESVSKIPQRALWATEKIWCLEVHKPENQGAFKWVLNLSSNKIGHQLLIRCQIEIKGEHFWSQVKTLLGIFCVL